MAGIFKAVGQSISAASDASVTMFATLDNVAHVGLAASADWRSQSEFELSLKERARKRLTSNEQALNLIESQLLAEMVGDYLPGEKTAELFALPN